MGTFGNAGENVPMEYEGFTHPGVRMVRDPGRLEVTLPVKAQKYRRLLHLVWAWIWLSGEVILIATLAGYDIVPAPPPPRAFLLTFFAAFTAAGVFVLWRLLWYMAGRETFDVTRGRLLVRRSMLGLGRTRTFEPGRIRSIRGQQLSYRVVYPSWGRMFIGHGNGEVLIDTADGSYAYARGLEEEEAGLLASLLTGELKLHPRDRRPSEVRAG